MSTVVEVDVSSPSFVADLDRAWQTSGFVSLRGHGLDDAEGRSIIEATKQLFAVPHTTKRRLDVARDRNHRGYELLDGRQAFEIGRTKPDDGRGLCGPNRWPDSGVTPEARRLIDDYFDHCRVVCSQISEALVGVPSAPPNDVAHLRAWCYQPGAIELPPHADHGFLTLLPAPTAGLEIRDGSGRFEPAPPASGSALLMNVGRLLHHVSNGRYQPTVHRVRSSSAVARHSLAFFYAPNDDLRIGPPLGANRDSSTVGEYIAWGYSWQGAVNAGGDVPSASDDAVDY